MKQDRWKSKALIAALIAQILSLFVISGNLELAQSEAINVAVGAILQMLVAFGIVNNPTDSGGL